MNTEYDSPELMEAPPEQIWLAAISFMGMEMPLVANPCPQGGPLPDPYDRLRPQLLWSESTMLDALRLLQPFNKM